MPVLQDLLDGAGNQRKRGAQLVGYVGEEPELYIRYLLLYGYLMLQTEKGKEDIRCCKDDKCYEQNIEQIRPG